MTAVLGRQVTAKRPDGYLITTPWDGGPETIQDTVQCCHCFRHWILGRAMHEAVRGNLGFCMKCHHVCCPECQDKCVPKDRFLDNLEGADPTAITVGGGFGDSLWVP